MQCTSKVSELLPHLRVPVGGSQPSMELTNEYMRVGQPPSSPPNSGAGHLNLAIGPPRYFGASGLLVAAGGGLRGFVRHIGDLRQLLQFAMPWGMWESN